MQKLTKLIRDCSAGQWQNELILVSFFISSLQTVKLLLWEGENCHLVYFSALIPFCFSWVSLWLFWELLGHITGSLLVSFFRSWSAAVPDFEVRFVLMATFVSIIFLCFRSSVCLCLIFFSVVESVWKLANCTFPGISPEVAASQLLGLV